MAEDADSNEADGRLLHLNALINTWRCRESDVRGVRPSSGSSTHVSATQPPSGGSCGLVMVLPEDVLPDWTNRERTGVSLEHCHYLAHRFRDDGFQPRNQGRGGHDVPVVVVSQANPGDTPGLPPCAHCTHDTADTVGSSNMFTSLGSSHFNQALNLHRLEWTSIFDGCVYDSVRRDAALRHAVRHGVASIVLRGEIPENDRKFISETLNKMHGYSFELESASGQVRLRRWADEDGCMGTHSEGAAPWTGNGR
eukprot:CAMPEP_0198682886 /NCGR_PEP_ID=MMETSP1468-20131203/9614_1 /TAXON_ID=1461545 /ORGANISM="Mantoniella sp, Strain CCMP1436" /LENGTH=252 /DNA_ID=CAMNT_0044426357 /DNA_START=33 /DNA_END=788 /DNA_ORIENTATION=-